MTYREQLSQRIEQAFDAVERIVVGVERNPEAKAAWEQGNADGYTCGYYDGLTDARTAYDASSVDSRALLDQLAALEEQSLEAVRAAHRAEPFCWHQYSAARVAHRDWEITRRLLAQLLGPQAEQVLATAQPP